MNLFICGTLFLVILGVIFGAHSYAVEEIYYWKEIIYENLPYKDGAYIGKYPYLIPENNNVLGIGYHAQSGLMIVVVGRLRPGVPSALNAFCVADYEKESSPHLWGFPDYEKNTLKASFYGGSQSRQSAELKRRETYAPGFYNHFFGRSSNSSDSRKYQLQNTYNYQEDFSIITLYHPKVDDLCNRLYIVDTGTLYYSPTVSYFVQTPAIVVFNLPSNGCESRQFSVIRRVEIPNSFWKNPVGFAFITLDHEPKGSCDDVFLYITNVLDFSLVVYDYKRNKFWSFMEPSMNPIYSEANLVLNKNFDYLFAFGIINVVLGWPDKLGYRKAYYNPAASTVEYEVSTKVLKNPKRTSFYYNSNDFSLIGHRGCDSQTFCKAIDLTTGVIFFGEMQSNRIRCWNTHLPLNPDTIGVVYESDALQFASEILIDSEGYLWFQSSQIPIIFASEAPLNLTSITAQTFRVKASDAIKGTVCDLSFSYHS